MRLPKDFKHVTSQPETVYNYINNTSDVCVCASVCLCLCMKEYKCVCEREKLKRFRRFSKMSLFIIIELLFRSGPLRQTHKLTLLPHTVRW